MALKAVASSPTSSQRSQEPLTRTSNSPWPNLRAASAISFRGLVCRREVTELVIKAMSSTTMEVKKKMLAKARHISVRLAVSAATKTMPNSLSCTTRPWPVLKSMVCTRMGVPATNRFSGKMPPRSVMPE